MISQKTQAIDAPSYDRTAMRFTATLGESGQGGRWAVCPFDAAEAFGEARPPVRGTVNGVPFRSRLMRYGGTTYLGFPKAIREQARIDTGDALDIELERDDAPREVEVPQALAAALAADPGARAVFDGLAFTHRREYAEWIAEAKRDETRERRVRKAIEMLLAGTKHP
jgi:bifunctional DNA-binding transcriptional regulator/antitoxin component of YhaV-PrlF toxin-antitoxin module